jgi:hypothetical protein
LEKVIIIKILRTFVYFNNHLYMKKILSLAACFSIIISKAGILTVNNKASGPGQYMSLQTAIDSANAGDSIYVHGSATSYGNITINKSLSFFGTGHNPSKINNLVSEIGIVQLDSTATSGGSGSKITGFKINRISGYGGSGGSKNILVRRNYFISGGTKISMTGNTWTVENNIFNATSVNVNNCANIIIRNNIFTNSSITSSNQTSVLITNNIFLGTTPFTALSTVSNALITNNIFSGASANGTSVNTNTFNNNITYQTANDVIPSGTNTGSGNLTATNPLYTNVLTNTFNYTYDYTLQAASPGKNAGTDLTDIGVYGGMAPFIDLTGSPAIPQMKSISILNPMIPVGDSLQVIIKANKQQ